MKVFGITNYQQNHNLNNTKSYNQKHYLTSDCFVKSQPSFKAKNVYADIVKNTELTKKFMDIVGGIAAAAAVALLGKAAIDSADNTPESEATDIDKIVETAATQVSEESDLTKRLNVLENENSALKSRIKELEAQQQKTKESPTKEKSSEVLPDNSVQATEENGIIPTLEEPANSKVIFPKKRGRLNKSQEQLKNAVTGVELSQENCQKLTELCQGLISSTNLSDDLAENNDFISAKLADELTQAKNDSNKIEQIINNYHKKYILKYYITEPPKVKELTIVGKIDLDSIKTRKPKLAEKVSLDEDIIQTKKSEYGPSVLYQVPGTLNGNLQNNLTNVLLKFEKDIVSTGTNPKWMWKESMITATAHDVLEELKTRNKESGYKNIKAKDAELIASVINGEPRFKDFFTLHSALRLIDRFVVFDSDVPVDKQVKNILDKFTSVIQKALKEGLEVSTYKDTHDAISPRLTISHNYYNNEERAIFGTYDLIIAVCENQKPGQYKKRNKSALISTIFSKYI